MAAEHPDLIPSPDAETWRRELADKVSTYRARRPRAPRYPSLSLPFEPYQAPPQATRHEAMPLELKGDHPVRVEEEVEPDFPLTTNPDPPEVNRVIEFPRPWIPASPPADQLAEPVIERPRILEVPEVVPPPPALGGMLIEAAEHTAPEKRPGFEIPLNSALLTQRLLAAAVDGLIVVSAFALFAAAFLKINPISLRLPEALATAVPILAAFWVGFKYLMLVHGGTTPGLRAAKLQLNRFDGSAVPKSLRQWRVAATVLSAVSLGLGYVWFFLDEDALCWHDRITKTYLAPKS